MEFATFESNLGRIHLKIVGTVFELGDYLDTYILNFTIRGFIYISEGCY